MGSGSDSTDDETNNAQPSQRGFAAAIMPRWSAGIPMRAQNPTTSPYSSVLSGQVKNRRMKTGTCSDTIAKEPRTLSMPMCKLSKVSTDECCTIAQRYPP